MSLNVVFGKPQVPEKGPTEFSRVKSKKRWESLHLEYNRWVEQVCWYLYAIFWVLVRCTWNQPFAATLLAASCWCDFHLESVVQEVQVMSSLLMIPTTVIVPVDFAILWGLNMSEWNKHQPNSAKSCRTLECPLLFFMTWARHSSNLPPPACDNCLLAWEMQDFSQASNGCFFEKPQTWVRWTVYAHHV